MNILRLLGQQRPRPWQKTVEPVAQSASLLLLLGLGLASLPTTSSYLFSLCFLPAIWIALRHGLPGAIPATLAVNGAILAGGFGVGNPVTGQFKLLAAWWLLSLATLATAWAVSRGRRAGQQRLQQQLRRLADTMPQLVWTATPDGRVDYMNSLWQILSGLTLQPGGHWPWEPLVHPDDLPRTLDAWQKAVATSKGYEIEHRLRRADGTYHWYLSRCVP
ncbi:MAG TPA: PAS domain-containing protein, partial [Caldilineaceae bacterium]|nr:PAS domain-containing protein [Caldilineaceae bacterium]